MLFLLRSVFRASYPSDNVSCVERQRTECQEIQGRGKPSNNVEWKARDSETSDHSQEGEGRYNSEDYGLVISILPSGPNEHNCVEGKH